MKLTHAPPSGKFLAKSWQLLLIKGMSAIAFALISFGWPSLTLAFIVMLFGVYVAIDGASTLVAALRAKPVRGWLALSGALSLAAAAVCFFHPGLTTKLVVLLIGWWSLFRGIFELIGAFTKHGRGFTLSGLLALTLGIILLASPNSGAIAMLWIIAVFALLFGVVLVVIALGLRKLSQKAPRTIDI